MEGNITKLFEEFQHINDFQGHRRCDSDLEISERSSQDEETLQIYLDNLKHENFMLQASIKAWQNTLRRKLEEFKNADSKLDEIYTEIWSEREKFCSEAEKFSNFYGVFSDWWKAQMKFVSDLENLEQKTSEDEERRQKIKMLEKEVEVLKAKAEKLRKRREIAEVEVHATAEGDSASSRSEDEMEKVSSEKADSKKVKFSGSEDQIEVCAGGELAGYDLYSLVDLEKVRTANRNTIRRRRSNFLGRVKNILTKNE